MNKTIAIISVAIKVIMLENLRSLIDGLIILRILRVLRVYSIVFRITGIKSIFFIAFENQMVLVIYIPDSNGKICYT